MSPDENNASEQYNKEIMLQSDQEWSTLTIQKSGGLEIWASEVENDVLEGALRSPDW